MLGQKIIHYRYILIALCLLLAAGALLYTSDLKIATNLSEMLPDNHPLVKATAAYEAAFGSGEKVFVAIASTADDSLTIRHDAARWLEAKLKALSSVAAVTIGSPEANRYLDAKNDTITVAIITPKIDNADFVNTRTQFFKDLNAVLEGARIAFPSLQLAFTGGAFVQDYEADGVLEQGIFSSLGMVLVLVVLIVMLSVKRIWMPLALSVPLVIGCLLTFAMGKGIFGTLNLFSVFFAAVLFGLGIDFGVHYLVRYDVLKKQGLSTAKALGTAMGTSGVGILIGAMTTSAAFFSFLFTSFKGFRQMGVMAGMGILILAGVMLTMVPAMLAIGAQSRKFVQREKRLEQRIKNEGTHMPKLKPYAIALALVLMVSSAILGAGSLLGQTLFGKAPLVFDYSIPAVYPKDMTSTAWQQRLETAYNTRIETLVVKLPSLEALENTHQALAARESEGVFQLKSILTAGGSLMGTTRISAEWVIANREGLPQGLVDDWRGSVGDKSYWRLEITPSHAIVDMGQYRALESEIIAASGEQPVGFIALMMHLGHVVTSDVAIVAAACSALIVLLLIASFRQLWLPLGMVLGLSLTLLSTWGAATWLGLSLNLMSAIAFPIVIGIGIDGFVHVGHALVHKEKPEALRALYRALWVTTATTMVGFGSLAFVNHGGLKNLGAIAAIAMAFAYGYQLLLVPTWYRWTSSFQILRPNKGIDKSIQKRSMGIE